MLTRITEPKVIAMPGYGMREEMGQHKFCHEIT
jgi:hypothetical protein